MSMTGSRSRVRLKGRLGSNAGMVAWLSKVRSQVCPSGRALATASLPMDPAAPGRFSTIIGTPSRCISPGETKRATASVDPPGPKGTTMRMELPCAWAGRMLAAAKPPSVARRVSFMVMSSLCFCLFHQVKNRRVEQLLRFNMPRGQPIFHRIADHGGDFGAVALEAIGPRIAAK